MKLLISVLLCLTCFSLMACTATSRLTPLSNHEAPHTIYFIYTGWHTSILIDAPTLLAHSPQLAKDFEGPRYFRVGWGDGDYFTGKSKRWTTATKALVASGYSALQVLGYGYDPLAQIPSDTRVSLALSDEGVRQLASFIERSIARDVDGVPTYLPPSKMNDNLFYRATPHYSLFNNCNTWSSQALREAGLPMRGGWNLTASSVFKRAGEVAARQ
jgi:uncharacterized protein (TIGR02117 family)